MKKVDRWEEQDRLMRSEYCHPVESFPNKMDELMEALDRVVSIYKPKLYARIYRVWTF